MTAMIITLSIIAVILLICFIREFKKSFKVWKNITPEEVKAKFQEKVIKEGLE